MLIKTHKDEYGLHFILRIFDFNINIKLNRDYKIVWTLGIRNNTEDNRYVVFMDYDCILLEHLINEIRYLQRTFKLSDFYILKASQKPNSYHAICIDKLNRQELMNILKESSIDEYYRTMPLENDYGSWVLRILPKKDSKAPKLLTIIKSKYNNRKKSLAHYLFLKSHHGIEKKPKNLDKYKTLYTVNYGTLNYIDEKQKVYNKKETEVFE